MPTVAANFVLIVVARITDVSLDTIRTASIIQGRRDFAAVLGFFEAVIYICVVAKVLLNMNRPAYALAYGVGFACGTYLGILIEQYLAFGDQVISLFTRKGLTLSKALLDAGYRIAEVEAHVREGDLTIVYVEVARRKVRSLLHQVSSLDPSCFSVISDVRMAKFIGPAMPKPVQTARVAHPYFSFRDLRIPDQRCAPPPPPNSDLPASPKREDLHTPNPGAANLAEKSATNVAGIPEICRKLGTCEMHCPSPGVRNAAVIRRGISLD